MKKNKLFCASAMALLAGPLLAAGAGLKDDVTSAVQNLNDIGNYSWHATVTGAGDPQFNSGSADGETEKGGITYVQLSFGTNNVEFARKGGIIAITDPSGNWQTLGNLDTNQGPNRLAMAMARHFQNPDVQAVKLAAAAADFTEDNGACTGVLTEDAVKTLLNLRGGGEGNATTVTNVSGSVTFWVTDGALTKFEFKVAGTVNVDGNDRDIERDTTVDIKYVNATKVTTPNEARRLL
jgi:hypothetical protein